MSDFSGVRSPGTAGCAYMGSLWPLIIVPVYISGGVALPAFLPAVASAAQASVSGTAARSTWVSVSSSYIGAPGPGHDGQWFDRIHVQPRRVDLGTIAAERTIPIEIWNAWRRGYVLTGVVVTGSSGVTCAPGTTPRTFLPFHVEMDSIVVAPAGPATVYSIVQWAFQGSTETGSYTEVTGLRTQIFTARPNGATAVEETYGYQTDVMVAWDGTEMRTRGRELAARSLRYSVTFVDPVDVAETMGRLFVGGKQLFGVPIWRDATQTALDTGAGFALIYLNTTGRGFAAGGQAILYRSQRDYELVTVDDVFADHIILVGSLSGNWPAGSVVAPVLSGRLLTAPTLQRESGNVATLDIEFSLEAS